MTCKDCLHYEACTHMLEAMGYTVDGDGADADKWCNDFADRRRFVEIPCRLGDAVYWISPARRCVIKAHVTKIGFSAEVENGYEYDALLFGEIGKTVFLTSAEAEAKLKEMER